jgi:hypothetical protein
MPNFSIEALKEKGPFIRRGLIVVLAAIAVTSCSTTGDTPSLVASEGSVDVLLEDDEVPEDYRAFFASAEVQQHISDEANGLANNVVELAQESDKVAVEYYDIGDGNAQEMMAVFEITTNGNEYRFSIRGVVTDSATDSTKEIITLPNGTQITLDEVSAWVAREGVELYGGDTDEVMLRIKEGGVSVLYNLCFESGIIVDERGVRGDTYGQEDSDLVENYGTIPPYLAASGKSLPSVNAAIAVVDHSVASFNEYLDSAFKGSPHPKREINEYCPR